MHACMQDAGYYSQCAYSIENIVIIQRTAFTGYEAWVSSVPYILHENFFSNKLYHVNKLTVLSSGY
jgi:hypothetical protein